MGRLDHLLVARGLAATRSQAQKLILGGCVQVSLAGQWQTCVKPAQAVAADAQLQVQALDELRFVSRAGLKLQGALSQLGLDPRGRSCLDIGQSTGGFSDCLLQQGAAQVVGVEVGRDQLAPPLRDHPRLVCLEGINARDLSAEQLKPWIASGFDWVVMDVSFISQCLIHPRLAALLVPGGWLISLVKPQFEAGREHLGKGGIVRDGAVYPQVEARIRQSLEQQGFSVHDYFPSPLLGGDGNQEFFVAARAPQGATGPGQTP